MGINLQVRTGNEAAVKSYESIGNAAEEVRSLVLRLVNDQFEAHEVTSP